MTFQHNPFDRNQIIFRVRKSCIAGSNTSVTNCAFSRSVSEMNGESKGFSQISVANTNIKISDNNTLKTEQTGISGSYPLILEIDKKTLMEVNKNGKQQI